MDKPQLIRHAVLSALARDRIPGWSFTGLFQNIAWPRIDDSTMTVTMPLGPQCTDAAGNVELAALLVLLDAALASPTRIALAHGTRMATTQINAHFHGVMARDDVSVESAFDGATEAGSLRQLLSSGRLTSRGRKVISGNGAFVQLPPPATAGEMAPLPWQRHEWVEPPALTPEQLDARESAIYAACEAALRDDAAVAGNASKVSDASDANDASDTASANAALASSFLKRFWGIAPVATNDGATCRLVAGPQLANRVGHVQGGILMGAAAETARLAVPGHPVFANLSAWFIAPGRGDALNVSSRVVHAGRSLAVVRTEITGTDGARVLDVTSAHAA